MTPDLSHNWEGVGEGRANIVAGMGENRRIRPSRYEIAICYTQGAR